MKFSLVALLAAASSVVAQTPGFDVLTAPAQNEVLKAGSTYKIVWEANNVGGTVTLTLIQGAASNLLEKGPVLGSGINNLDGHFNWVVPDAQFAAYGLNITLDSDPSTYQLSNGFHIKGSATPPKSSKAHTTSYTTISLAPGPSYSAAVPTTTAPVVPTYNITSTYPSSNVTWTKPTSSKISAAPTYPVEPTGPAPSGTQNPGPSTPSAPVSGAASIGVSGLAVIGGLLLTFAL